MQRRKKIRAQWLGFGCPDRFFNIQSDITRIHPFLKGLTGNRTPQWRVRTSTVKRWLTSCATPEFDKQATDLSPSPGSAEKYFSNLSGWSSKDFASVGAGF